MIDASITLSRPTPCTRSTASTTAPYAGVGPMAQVPTACHLEHERGARHELHLGCASRPRLISGVVWADQFR